MSVTRDIIKIATCGVSNHFHAAESHPYKEKPQKKIKNNNNNVVATCYNFNSVTCC
jgi:hypothetical protein